VDEPTRDAAEIIKKILELELPFEIYHAANQGFCTWFQFAEEIFRMTKLTPVLRPIKTGQMNTKAERPLFSALKSTKLQKCGIKVRDWKKGLRDYLVQKGHIQAI
jgi:dTDP-4-dehydrorhamnose reductase